MMPKNGRISQQETGQSTQPNIKSRERAKNATALNSEDLLARELKDLTPQEANHLQRTIGNQALQQLSIQRKMNVGPVGNKYEQEADAVADQIVSQINLPASPKTAQRQEVEELQAKSDPMLSGGEVSQDIETAVTHAKSGGSKLDDPIRQPMEHAFGADFSGVKIHTDHQADQLNRSLSARAFTSGQDVFFRSGEYNPNSSGGQNLLAHELTHTIQQGGVGVKRQVNSAATAISAMRLPHVQRAWDVDAIEKAHPKPFASLLAKMHEISMFRRKILTDLAAVTDSPGQLDKLVARIPAHELKKHLAAFPHPEIIRKIVYLCKGSSQFNGIMQTISTLSMADEIVELFSQETAVTLTEIDSVIDAKKESEGLKAGNGTIIGLKAVGSFANEEQTAIQDALDAYDDGSEHPWSGKWGDYHGNNSGDLPGVKGHGGYKEYDVRKDPKDKSRWGGRRLVIHNATGRIYYTWTHYGDDGNPAFVRIR